MEEKELIINSNCDNLKLHVSIFIPDIEIKGIIQISHGMAEHKERYFKFMKYMTNLGYVTVINDHRGHGKSIKEKDDVGYFYDEKAEYIVEDLHQITLYIKSLYPNKKLILFGHSMGSMVVRKYIKKYDTDIDKLIVCGSPSKNPYVNLALKLTEMIKKIKGEKHRSQLIQKLAFGSYNRNFKNVKSINSWICSNDEIVDEYDNDGLCGFIFTTNGFLNLFNLVKDIYSKEGWTINNSELPILFIAGSDDPVIINKNKWLESQDFLLKLGYHNIDKKLYDGLRHEILNEKQNELIYQDILEFINKS